MSCSFKIPDCFDENVCAFWAGPTLVEKEDGNLYSNDTKYAVKIGNVNINRKFPLFHKEKDTPVDQVYYIKMFGDRARHWSTVYYMSSGNILYKTLDDYNNRRQMV
jgi:hypothetical protein